MEKEGTDYLNPLLTSLSYDDWMLAASGPGDLYHHRTKDMVQLLIKTVFETPHLAPGEVKAVTDAYFAATRADFIEKIGDIERQMVEALRQSMVSGNATDLMPTHGPEAVEAYLEHPSNKVFSDADYESFHFQVMSAASIVQDRLFARLAIGLMFNLWAVSAETLRRGKKLANECSRKYAIIRGLISHHPLCQLLAGCMVANESHPELGRIGDEILEAAMRVPGADDTARKVLSARDRIDLLAGKGAPVLKLEDAVERLGYPRSVALLPTPMTTSDEIDIPDSIDQKENKKKEDEDVAKERADFTARFLRRVEETEKKKKTTAATEAT